MMSSPKGNYAKKSLENSWRAPKRKMKGKR